MFSLSGSTPSRASDSNRLWYLQLAAISLFRRYYNDVRQGCGKLGLVIETPITTAVFGDAASIVDAPVMPCPALDAVQY